MIIPFRFLMHSLLIQNIPSLHVYAYCFLCLLTYLTRILFRRRFIDLRPSISRHQERLIIQKCERCSDWPLNKYSA
ncbi:hypothetical protein BJY04DRAFT_188892 [Aspergillus karnatakaensis]|uniref:uncharacterized protein n=1 Tax=Aspergillus karnatakaensis TaxID=1810916 RepID=UPI003CCD72B9